MSATMMPMMPTGAMPMSPTELERFDAPLIALANLAGGDLRKLFTAFFSFLHRRTDFYCILPDEQAGGGGGGAGRNMGFREGQAERIMLASFRQFPLRKMGPQSTAAPTQAAPPSAMKGKAGASSALEAGRSTSKVVIARTDLPPGDKAPPAASKSNDGAKESGTGGKSEGGGSDSGSGGGVTTAAKSSAAAAIRYTEEGKQIPVGNGGSTSRYVWTQTLEEVTVLLPIPPGTRGKDLDVKIAPTSLSVKLKDGAGSGASSSSDGGDGFVLNPLEGTLFAKCRTSESTWTLESDTVIITLDKYVKTWWGTVYSGDPEIDNTLVDSTRKIDTYDEATQAQIRRIMFDQRQERLGLPSSEELSGEEAVKVPPLPNGVEFIDGETLDKANISKK